MKIHKLKGTFSSLYLITAIASFYLLDYITHGNGTGFSYIIIISILGTIFFAIINTKGGLLKPFKSAYQDKLSTSLVIIFGVLLTILPFYSIKYLAPFKTILLDSIILSIMSVYGVFKVNRNKRTMFNLSALVLIGIITLILIFKEYEFKLNIIVAVICAILYPTTSFYYAEYTDKLSSDCSLSAKQILLIRYFFIALISLIVALFFHTHLKLKLADFTTMTLYSILGIFLPNWLYQKSILADGFLLNSMILAFSPIVFYFIESVFFHTYILQYFLLALISTIFIVDSLLYLTRHTNKNN